ncbi:glycoside hydrolase family 55 protein [Botryobasidium botryosum FD-172 SS1]|uniref:Glycoside hydrolase family 55 protein n=1 Tax=Botryobasidium botryosum (strain FD-172 SS1) TaxID=930990 RepID=A0A067MKJ3_BOTB1|nr:glycoside hydrolase family 55 protein [Botryobasidium botryosum FD-172 SS1]
MRLLDLVGALASAALSVNALGSQCSGPLGGGNADANAPFWLETIAKRGTSAFNNSPSSYKVFRNVKDYGAKGDGRTDDTNAINAAIADQGRCGLGCKSSTVSPGLIYFPQGTYVVSKPIIPFYYTNIVGDAKRPPTLLASSNFNGMAVIDADPYLGGDAQYWTNQVCNLAITSSVRNIVIDLRQIPASSSGTGLHWQVAQATSLVNVRVEASQAAGNNHQGENGSGGVLSDVTFNGGKFGIWVGNQQFTVRNLKVTNAATAVFSIWNWGWTYQNVIIDNCKIGFEISTGGTDQAHQTSGANVILDATVTNTPVFVRTSTSQRNSLGGSVFIDNAKLTNVPIAVQDGSGATILAGGTTTINQWAQGNIYYGNSNKATYVQKTLTAPSKPSVLLDSTGKFFNRARPQYENYSPSQFVSVKAEGARGDGSTDDTAALQAVFDKYWGCRIIYVDAGTYKLTKTLNIPTGTTLVGEMWSVFLANGSPFNNVNNPTVVAKVGNPGDVGAVEISDVVFSTVAGSAGAIVLQVNTKQSSQGAVGIWDTHVRLGGARGTNLQVPQCQKQRGHGAECASSFLSLHIGKTASAYLENVWVWTADHDLDDGGESQIDIFAGRGIFSESTDGPVWMIGTASEHHAVYQYNIVNSKNVYAGLIQTETPYYQPSPAPSAFFPVNPTYNDPNYASGKSSLALIVQKSSNVFVYGAGLYSFFSNYGQACLDTYSCQDQITEIASSNTNTFVYSLSTVGTTYSLSQDGVGIIRQADNRNGFASTATVYTPNGNASRRWIGSRIARWLW